MHNTMLSSTGM